MPFPGKPWIAPGRPFCGAYAGNPAWTPGTLSPLVWLDFSDASSCTLNGGTVSAFANKGSIGGSFSQSTAGRQPKWNSPSPTLPSVSSITVDSSTIQYLTKTGMSAVSSMTEVLVFKVGATPPVGTSFITAFGGYGAGANNVEVSVYGGATSYGYVDSALAVNNWSSVYGNSKSFRRWWTFDASSTTPFGSPASQYVNAVQKTVAATSISAPGTAGGGKWSIGANIDGSFPAQAEIFQWIVYGRSLSAAELLLVDAWVTSKYAGITWG